MTSDVTNIENKWLYPKNKFIESSFYLTINEQKILRILASMVQKGDQKFKAYEFKVVELAELLGVNKKNAYREFEKTADLLMSRFVKIKEGGNKKNWASYHIIERAKCKEGILTLQIHPDMEDFFLQLKEKLDAYTGYQLKNVLQFKGTYSFRFYELLKQQQKLGSRTFEIEELKEILDIPKGEYKQYSHLKSRVINPSQKEICEKTDICFDYEEYKEKNKVIKIKFYIYINQTVNEEKEENYEISEMEKITIEKIVSIIKEPITSCDALELINLYNQDLELLKQNYDIIKASYYDATKIKNIVAILRDALQNPTKYQHPKSGTGQARKHYKVHNFKSRYNTPEDLEKALKNAGTISAEESEESKKWKEAVLATYKDK